jgi:hypothetical protein
MTGSFGAAPPLTDPQRSNAMNVIPTNLEDYEAITRVV